MSRPTTEERNKECADNFDYLVNLIKPKNPKVKMILKGSAAALACIGVISGYFLLLAVALVAIILGLAAKS